MYINDNVEEILISYPQIYSINYDNRKNILELGVEMIMNNFDNIIKSTLTDDSLTATALVNLSGGNEITDKVKEEIAMLSSDEIAVINTRLERILEATYFEENNLDLSNFNEQEIFLLRESLIYYIGRITTTPNINLLKRIYYIEKNKHLQLNLVFASLLSSDEELETDFIEKLIPGSDYDIMLRSWTLAFFSNSESPYDYIDEGNDWSIAKKPRLNRLAINDEAHPKIKKAIAFRWLDLVVLWLFLNNRGFDTMRPEEYKIIENTKVDFPSYSDKKIEAMQILKAKILRKKK